MRFEQKPSKSFAPIVCNTNRLMGIVLVEVKIFERAGSTRVLENFDLFITTLMSSDRKYSSSHIA